MTRYSRQISLPEIGEGGQEKLHKARVLIVGAGGLGSPAALYLAGAGVGTIGLADDDTVGISNLQRQILYTENEVGQLKVHCAAQRLRALNGNIEVHAYPFRLNRENARRLIADYDIVDISYSTREPAFIRDHMATLGVTTMSAESKTEPGGYYSYPQTLEQFHVSDERKAVEVDKALKSLGREPVWKDWDASFDLKRV